MKIYYIVKLSDLSVKNYELNEAIDDDFNEIQALDKVELTNKDKNAIKIKEVSDAYAMAKHLRGYVLKFKVKNEEDPDIQVVKSYSKK